MAMVKPPHAHPVGTQVTVLGWVPLRRYVRVRLAEGLAASRRVQHERSVDHAADIGCKMRARYSPGTSIVARSTEGFLRRKCLDGVRFGADCAVVAFSRFAGTCRGEALGFDVLAPAVGCCRGFVVRLILGVAS